jgi:hypothetical protein
LREGVKKGKNSLKGEVTKSWNLSEEGVTEGWKSLTKFIIIKNCLKQKVKKCRNYLEEGVMKSSNGLEEGVKKHRSNREEEAAEGRYNKLK